MTTSRSYDFDTPRPPRLGVEIGSGSVDITAVETDCTHVEITGEHADEVSVGSDHDTVTVMAPDRRGLHRDNLRIAVTVTVPLDSEVIVQTGSADVQVDGRIDTARVRTGSGSVHVAEVVHETHIETGSGDVRLERTAGGARFKSGSGRVSVGVSEAELVVSTGSGEVDVEQSAGATAVKTGSGDLVVAAADGDVSLSTGSGDLRITTATRGRVTVKGGSGSVQVGVPAGVPVWTDVRTVSGTVRSDLEPTGAPAEGQDHVELRATLGSGDVELVQRSALTPG